MIPVLWDIFLRSPITGTGPDRYQYELTRRAMPYMTEKQQTINSHNLALLLLVETGRNRLCFLFRWYGQSAYLSMARTEWPLRLAATGLAAANEHRRPDHLQSDLCSHSLARDRLLSGGN